MAKTATSKGIALLGEGFPAPLWEGWLAQAHMPYERDRLQGPPMYSGTVNFIIETEDVRNYSAAPTPEPPPDEMYEDDGLPFPGLEAPETEVGLMLAAGGIALVPCYYAAPTEMAAALEEWAPRAVGYTLFPNGGPEGSIPIIELARGIQTEDDAWNKAVSFAERAGFRTEIAGDAPGLVFGRTLACLINEAARAFGEGIASSEDIDRAMRLGVNYPKGLFEWADEYGIPFILGILDGLYDHYLEERYRAAPLLRMMAMAGRSFSGGSVPH